jgi:hypothetical protein
MEYSYTVGTSTVRKSARRHGGRDWFGYYYGRLSFFVFGTTFSVWHNIIAFCIALHIIGRHHGRSFSR